MPNQPIKVSASTCAPPETSRIFPIIAPRPTNKATDANVPPKPLSMAGTICENSMPVATAVQKLTIISAGKA